jgi:hypothetical protein
MKLHRWIFLMSVTILSIAMLANTVFSQLTTQPIPVDTDWWSKCVSTASCPSQRNTVCRLGSCSWCSAPVNTGACERFHWSSCAESDYGPGSCGTAIAGFCGLNNSCMELDTSTSSRPCNYTHCTS